ncbi:MULTISPECIES: eCIS core domain-containing protein [unclassified Amycolatopsis]|uniref:eCIS core domain-containing protein n=1 Tax=unclassified Amycolatopsis TaxID=2618356 RepID=UPI002E0FCCD2|nr:MULTISPECIES: DUF4157 domain-containing protein [unclassified Amycolatopsis]WSJ78815.1 DUF4157 domain-containing protein [Amycolatopsis sp. NBC_01307]WSK77619.1 DUF4157 domain-containing protein [Amycolatopsis sp. NBC_01286]
MIETAHESHRTPSAPEWSAALIRNSRGKGQRLDADARRILQRFFGRNLSAVRVHLGSDADDLARSLGARAVTTGTDIYFRSGEYRPDLPAGLALLAHEVTHVLQQATFARGCATVRTGVLVGAVDGAPERAALAVERRLLTQHDLVCASAHRAGQADRDPVTAGRAGGLLLQCGIGLEVEIPIPIDRLTPAQLVQIQGWVAAGTHANTLGATQANGRVPYGIIANAPVVGVAPGAGYRIDADHDNRVKSNPGNPPIREGGYDSILEIVTEPPVGTAAAFTTVMNHVQGFIGNINANTNNLTTRWVNAFPGVALPGGLFDISIGPMDFTAQGHPLAVKLPHHNLQGSVQVNIDIDLREYQSLLKWYANSNYAASANAPAAEQPMYSQIKDDIRDAVNAGRTITATISAAHTAAQRAQAGNFRGLRGWITHLALYLKRGMIGPGVLGGSAKNLVPILVKSPNNVLTTYGFTAAEMAYYTGNKNAVLNQIMAQLGRPAIAGPLAGIPVFAANPAGLNLNQLADEAAVGVPLAGTPVLNPPNLGAWRTGNAAVQAIAQVPGGANSRGGLVAEFRNFPGFYNGVAAWRTLGLDFLAQATTRNARNGIVA